MILITSGAYIADDFASEVGVLPPSFLPLANKRLFEYQYELLKHLNDDIYISIPQNFEIDAADEFKLKQLNIEIIRAPEGINLGSSILYCWCSTGRVYENLTLLHGDTLLNEVTSYPADSISVHKNNGYYQRAKIYKTNDDQIEIEDLWAGADEMVISGFFSFSKPQILIQGIAKNNYSFIKALKHYSRTIDVSIASHGQWFDFGHLNSFFRSRSEITTQRAFNEMKISARVVEKSSKNNRKMQAESFWFSQLPSELKIFTPTLLSTVSESGQIKGYKLEYLYLLPLSDLFVFGNLSVGAWRQIFSAIWEVLTCFRNQQIATDLNQSFDAMNSLYLKKTQDRLKLFKQQTGFDIDKQISLFNSSSKPISLSRLAEICASKIQHANNNMLSVSHGDLCFSNILYDSRVQSLKLIDPRGTDSNENFTIYGDFRYDLAKLYHSVIGQYDLIIAGRFTLDFDEASNTYKLNIFSPPRQQEIENLFVSQILDKTGFEHREILSITILLFISMLPLHYDNPERQSAMIANALRLHEKLELICEKNQ